MKRLIVSFFLGILLALVGVGLLGAVPAFAQVDPVAFKQFAQDAGFSTGPSVQIIIARLIRTAISLVGIVVVIMIIYAGFLWMTSGGDAQRLTKAKKIMAQAIVGLLIVLSAFTIVHFVLKTFYKAAGLDGGGGGGGGGGGSTCTTCKYPDNKKAFVMYPLNTQCAGAIRNYQPQFTFSKSVDPSTASKAIVIKEKGGEEVKGTYSVSANQVTFTPSDPCPAPQEEAFCFKKETEYVATVTAGELKSTGGDLLTCNIDNLCSYSFKTGVGIDTEAPQVSMSAPADGSEAIVGDIVKLQAKTKDDTGVSSVKFYALDDDEPIFISGLSFSDAGTLVGGGQENVFSTDQAKEWDTSGYVTDKSYPVWATGLDCAGHKTKSTSISIEVRPLSCNNKVQDNGEMGVDCGGGGCGACDGGGCKKNSDCASGYCKLEIGKDGVCETRPRIDLVSPGDGAIGNLVTISGKGFGEQGGTVTFLGTAQGQSVEVQAYQCLGKLKWSDTEIVVQVPTTAKDGALEVTTSGPQVKKDRTNDDFGYLLSDFDVNAIKRPGLCLATPLEGVPGTGVKFDGLGFGSSQGSSTMYFKNFVSSSYLNPWTDISIQAVVPNMWAGSVSTQLFTGDFQCIDATGKTIGKACASDTDCGTGNTCATSWCSETLAYCSTAKPCATDAGKCTSVRVGSNTLSFTVKDPTEGALAPVLSYIDSGKQICDSGTNANAVCQTNADCEGGACVAAGPKGQYVTLYGSNFGISKGKVEFTSGLSSAALGDVDFPDLCKEEYWHDTYVTIKVPSKSLADTELAFGTYQVKLTRKQDDVAMTSNAVPFVIMDGKPGPSICKIDPSGGPASTAAKPILVEVIGEHFGAEKGTVTFYENQSASYAVWSTDKVANQVTDVQVPEKTKTGPVFVTSAAGASSNKLNYKIGNCNDGSLSCGVNEQCCANGSCSSKCALPPPEAHFAYKISTGEIPDNPIVKVACDNDTISPSPWNGWTDSKTVCINTEVTATFGFSDSKKLFMLDTASVVNHVKMEQCVKFKADSSCEKWSTLTGGVMKSGATSFSWLPPTGMFAANTHYRVTIKGGEGGVRAHKDVGAAPLLKDYVWEFTTGTEKCEVGAVNVSPATFTATKDHQVILENSPGYLAQPIAKNYKCQVLSCEGQSIQWSSDFAGAIVKEPSSGAGLCEATIVAEDETPKNAPAHIKAQVTNVFKKPADDGLLTIEFNDPTVGAFFPNCTDACVNARPWARFKTEMDPATINSSTVLLYECVNALCAKNDLIDVAIKNVSLNPQTNTLFVDFNNNVSLKPKTWYRVLLRGNMIKSISNVPLKDSGTNYGSDQNKYYEDHFSWKFRSKDSDILCTFNTLSVSPELTTLKFVEERQDYYATLYGPSDACDASGQALQNWAATKFFWQPWKAEDTPNNYNVAQGGSSNDVAFMWNSGSIALSSNRPSWCSSICLNTGSSLPAATAVCGNGSALEVGEECDDGNSTSGDGCSSVCLFEGKNACGQNKILCCGNTTVDAGEQCDDGNSAPGDGCSDKCLNEGSASVGAICGDKKIDFDPKEGGEDCDDGNTKNGDGCSSQCVKEGSIPKTQVFGKCGNGGAPESGEDCDDGNTKNGDGCSAKCLNEGTLECVTTCSDTGNSCLTNADCNAGAKCMPPKIPCCGNGGAPEKGEDCDDQNNISGDGCSAQCLKEGSSIQYTNPSFCGDGKVQVGEECDVQANQTFEVGGYALAEIAPNAPKEVSHQTGYAISKISATAENVKGEATLQIQCSCETDQACGSPAMLGCGAGSCCFKRPKMKLPYQPATGYGPGGKGYCRNTAIWVQFDQKMEPSTFNQIRLRLVKKDGNYITFKPELCPASYQLVNADLPSSNHPIARAWHWLTRKILSWAAPDVVAASNKCYAPLLYDAVDLPDGGERIILSYADLLEPSATYYIETTSDTNSFDGIKEGAISANQVSMCLGGKCETGTGTANYLSYFLTSAEVCLLEAVGIEDHGNILANTNQLVEPSPRFFSKKAETHAFQAQALTYRDGLGVYEPIQSIPAYGWKWDWGSSAQDCDPATANCKKEIEDGTIVNIVNLLSIDQKDTRKAQFHASGSNGSEQVLAGATITADKLNNPPTNGEKTDGTLEVIALTCERPWPPLNSPLGFPYIEKGDAKTAPSNFGFYYCMDRGVYGNNDDLPELDAPIDVSSTDPNKFFQEILFKVKGTPDAIGVRVVPNPNYLSAKDWYEQQGFGSAYSDIKMDGYEGVQSGNTAYVAAANEQGKVLYPNIYVVSYNPTAGADAKEIFAQILDHWRFNANTDVITNVGLCKIGNSYVKDTSEEFISCQWDGDCVDLFEGGECSVSKLQPDVATKCTLHESKGAYCDSEKAKLQKDLKRLTDINLMKEFVDVYGNTHKHCSVTKTQACSSDAQCPGAETVTEKCVPGYPTLQQGTFVPALTVSKWESWNAQLSNELGFAMPKDPIDQYFLQCKTQGADYDPVTCFNTKESKFVCPNGSHVYGYQSQGGEKYTLFTQLEYNAAPWNSKIDKFDKDSATIVVEYAGTGGNPAKKSAPNGPPSNNGVLSDGFVALPQFCATGKTWGISSICGDGVVGLGEKCEPGNVKAIACKKAGEAYDCPEKPPVGWQPDGYINVTCKADCSGFQSAPEAQQAGASFVSLECGNGILEPGEDCDDGSLNGTYGHCGVGCELDTAFICGDGKLAGSEQCDCGNNAMYEKVMDDPGAWANQHPEICGQPNGQYSPLANSSCSYDCKIPGPSCGDKEINGAEECDGQIEIWAGKLCTDFKKTPCETNSDCPVGTSCAPDAEANYDLQACGSARICLAGSQKGKACKNHSDCPGSTCSVELYPLSRTRVCGTGVENKCTWPAWPQCLGGDQNCKNGKVEGSEQCDDGNQSNNDSCTTECKKNSCGDGYLFTGVEACDNGGQNKLPDDPEGCSAPYGATCNYCNTLCQYKTVSGAYCGDGKINGTEYCDGEDQPYFCFNTDGGKAEKGGTCSASNANKVDSFGGCDDGFTCRYLSICNGGSRNGKFCTFSPYAVEGYSGSKDSATCPKGQCVAPKCFDNCQGMCPFAYQTSTLLVQSEAKGAQPQSNIELYSYLNKKNETPDNALLHLPACSVGVGITANVDNSKVIKPDVDVVFITDLTGSMEHTVGNGKTKVQVAAEATEEAIDALFNAYAGQQGGKMRIGLVSYGGYPKNKYPDYSSSAMIDSGPDKSSALLSDTGVNKQTLKNIVQAYPQHSGGASNPQGVKLANEILKSQPFNHIKVAILLSDGKMYLADDGKYCPNKSGSIQTLGDAPENKIFIGDDYCTAEIRYNFMNPNTDLFYYSAIISTNDLDKAYMEHMSSMKCAGQKMSDLNDCEEGKYAFSANTPAEIKAMYDEIAQAILGAATTVTTLQDGQIDTATSVTPAGNNVTIQVPESFACQNKSFTMPIRTTFYGDGTMKFDNFVFQYCPIE